MVSTTGCVIKVSICRLGTYLCLCCICTHFLVLYYTNSNPVSCQHLCYFYHVSSGCDIEILHDACGISN